MRYKIYSRLWIETEKGVFLGEGRYRLLKAISDTGSLSKAAKLLNMSYKKAWKLNSAVNYTGEKDLTITTTGGIGGGGTILTEYGIKAVKAFEDLNTDCWAYLDEQEKKFMK